MDDEAQLQQAIALSMQCADSSDDATPTSAGTPADPSDGEQLEQP
jgi:hypothetical protein